MASEQRPQLAAGDLSHLPSASVAPSLIPPLEPLLRRIVAFRSLSPPAMQALIAYVTSRPVFEVPPGQAVCPDTRLHDNVPFLVVRGTIEVCVHARRSTDPVELKPGAAQEQAAAPGAVLATLRVGDVSGYQQLLRDRLYSRSTLWIGNHHSEEGGKEPQPNPLIITLDRAGFQGVLQSQPSIALALLNKLNKADVASNTLSASHGPLSDTAPVLRPATKLRVIRCTVFDAKSYDRVSLLAAVERAQTVHPDLSIELSFVSPRLSAKSVPLAAGADVVCLFVNDQLDASVAYLLRQTGVGLVCMRCAGYDRVDIDACDATGLSIARVPEYSPHAVAEHVLALCMALNRHLIRAHSRVRDHNFELQGLVGFDMHGKTVGVYGTGKIGKCVVMIMLGLGCKVLCTDLYPDKELLATPGVSYVSREELCRRSDIITLHLPLLKATHHAIDAKCIASMKRGVLFINCSRGGLVDSAALLAALKTGHIASAGLDVYEGEAGYFFHDWSGQVLGDDTLSLLSSHPNVLLTSHQAFLTREALQNIADTTINNILEFAHGKRMKQLTRSINKTIAGGSDGQRKARL